MNLDWSELLTAADVDALTVTCRLWLPPPPPDYLTAPCWWKWREPCDCPDTSFGRNPHRWNCPQTPIWAQMIRDLDTNPWTVVCNAEMSFGELWHLADYCGRGPCCLPGGHDGRCRM